MINSNPETVSTDFDASSRLYFEPLDPESVRSVIDAETAGRRDPAPGRRRVRRADAAQPRRTPRGRGRAAPRQRPGGHRPGRGARPLLRPARSARHPAAGGRDGPQHRGGADPRRADRLPGHRPAVVRHRRAGHRLLLLAGRTWSASSRRRPSSTRTGRSGSTATSRASRSTSTRSATASGCSSRASWSTSSGPVSTAATASAVFPPQTVSEGDQDLIVATMERIVLALGARGLVNAQFIVRDDGVYLIEVNPRASRTVPFLSKVTGVPMVELAVRIALGATLPDLGWEGGLLPPPPFVAVKAPAFSTAKLRGVDPSVGPGHAVDRRGHRAARGPARGAGQGARRCRARAAAVGRRAGALALLTHRRPRQGACCRAWPPALAGAGYRLAATPGTRRRWPASATTPGRWPSSARPPTRRSARCRSSTSSRSGEVRLVVNTPTPRSGAVRDAAEIRLAATGEGILCLTAMETAVAAAEALDPAIAATIAEVRPWRSGCRSRVIRAWRRSRPRH